MDFVARCMVGGTSGTCRCESVIIQRGGVRNQMVRRASDRMRSTPSERESMSVRSALGFRLALAIVGLLILGTVAVVAFAWNDPPFDLVVLGSACAFLAIVALIDIVVVLLRLRATKQNLARHETPPDIGAT